MGTWSLGGDEAPRHEVSTARCAGPRRGPHGWPQSGHYGLSDAATDACKTVQRHVQRLDLAFNTSDASWLLDTSHKRDQSDVALDRTCVEINHGPRRATVPGERCHPARHAERRPGAVRPRDHRPPDVAQFLFGPADDL